MGLLASNRSRLLAAVLSSLLLCGLSFLLVAPGWPVADLFLRSSYDSLHILAGAPRDATSHSPVIIVYLDLACFDAQKLDPALPWPRNLHGRLLARLTDAGARAVVFD